METTRSAVGTYWSALEARDWDGFAATMDQDVVYTLPQSRERIRGRDAYLRFNMEYPGDWQLTPARLVVEGSEAACWTDVRFDGEAQLCVTFFRLGSDGTIVAVDEVWPEHYEPPAGREHLVERY